MYAALVTDEALRDLEAFGSILDPRRYERLWIPVAILGGPGDAIGLSFLARDEGDGERVIEDTAWPETLGFGGPVVSTRFTDAGPVHEGELWPHSIHDGFRFEPFVMLFEPVGASRWMEPIQPFVMYWNAWPRRSDDETRWFCENEDGEPEEIARWISAGSEPGHRLEVRRDKLLAFLGAFGFDLAIYIDAHSHDVMAPVGSRYELRNDRWTAQIWMTEVSENESLATTRSVFHLPRPAYDDDAQPWSTATADAPVTFLVGIDSMTGRERRVSHPPDEFLTPVFFDRRVLEPYYEDPNSYEVRNGVVRARRWYLPIEITDSGLVQAWLGDLYLLSRRAQLHW